MKIKSEKVKESAFCRAVEGLVQRLRTFDTGHFDLIGLLCQDISTIDEFCNRSSRRLKLKDEALVRAYRFHVYSKMIALVLHDGSTAFSYTRKDLIKFLRGEYLHGDSDNRDKRRTALHDFAFEETKVVSLEYAVTWSFVIFPGIRSSIGNTDSDTPFVQSIKIEGREIETTQIESIVLSAAYEYWQALNGLPIGFNKVAVTNDLDAFSTLLGSDLVMRLKNEWKMLQRWQEQKVILL